MSHQTSFPFRSPLSMRVCSHRRLTRIAVFKLSLAKLKGKTHVSPCRCLALLVSRQHRCPTHVTCLGCRHRHYHHVSWTNDFTWFDLWVIRFSFDRREATLISNTPDSVPEAFDAFLGQRYYSFWCRLER